MVVSMNLPAISSPSPRNPRRIPPPPPGGRWHFSLLPAHGTASRFNPSRIRMNSSSLRDEQRCKSKLEALFSYDKSIPEEIIEKPIGLSLDKREIGVKPPCEDCEAKGVILCATCSGSGLYVDSILESQGIIVRVRCLGCGGTGNIICSRCGGRGHTV